jgi:hypothetical protein
MQAHQERHPAYLYWLLGVVILAVLAVVLYSMGRVPWCTCGYVKLWHGVTVSSENSQHLSDWYSFTHISHGLFLYFLLWAVDRKKRLSIGTRLLIAMGLEASWEIIENTSFVIERYRAATISLDYYGDSIVNSIGDVLFMAAGFYFAFRARPWAGIALFIALELLLAFFIRDNLTTNIIMLIHPLHAIRAWQAAP